ncbi:ankyrin repeat domain-containing protein [Paenibacillus hamazuiensis]|uniref:ankyrin repeat domain-containing protein n=1 Tax=Paenibacillus hamazuiensis TaxID=2936508 RepID=UPI00200FCB88|nr:ankyrin repeat domain-containing protein [Paenibacillus hamazuiensis]
MNQELLQAFKNKDIQTVKIILASGIDLNHRTPGTDTYLFRAWSGQRDYDFEIVKLLIEYGADLNDPASPAITMAAGKGSIQELQYVLDRGADINAVSHVGKSALWQAAYKGDMEVVKFLLNAGIDIDKHSGQALQIASSRGHLDLVEFLIKEKADINYQVFSKNNADLSYTPLHFSAMMQRFEIARCLLENGANPALKNYYGERPYTIAAKQKNNVLAELIASYEPKELHDLEHKIKELKKAGFPTSILKDLGEERSRVELPASKYVKYIEYCSIHDVTEMEIEGIQMFNLLFETNGYDSLGFLVWIPSKKALGSYEAEHQSLIILHDTDWKKFRKSPGIIIDRILDGEYEIVT